MLISSSGIYQKPSFASNKENTFAFPNLVTFLLHMAVDNDDVLWLYLGALDRCRCVYFHLFGLFTTTKLDTQFVGSVTLPIKYFYSKSSFYLTYLCAVKGTRMGGLITGVDWPIPTLY